MLNAKIKMKSICKFYCSKCKKSKGEMFEMAVARTVETVHTHTDSLIELKINGSRDRKSLLFCGMQNSR